MHDLDTFSERAWAAVVTAHPEWLPSMTAHPDTDSGSCYMLLSLPSPVDASRVLHLYSADEEFTLSFDMYERHFNEHEAAIAFAEQVTRDELLVASFWKGKEWTGSVAIEPNEQVTKPESFNVSSDNVKIRSWSGRLDREYAL